MSGSAESDGREAIIAELNTYVREVLPIRVGNSGYRRMPRCGREQAVVLTERIRPILDRLYPGWEEEFNPSNHFEFRVPRIAAERLAARLASQDEIAELLSRYDDGSPTIAASGFHPLIWQAASAQWSTGHRQEAVLAAAKAVNSQLQAKVERRDVSEVKLVREAFGSGPPKAGAPRLRFPSIPDQQTRESTEQGVLSFGVGCFQAIRNPVGHLPNDQHELGEQDALERLAALSLLARWIDEADVESADAK